MEPSGERSSGEAPRVEIATLDRLAGSEVGVAGVDPEFAERPGMQRDHQRGKEGCVLDPRRTPDVDRGRDGERWPTRVGDGQRLALR